MTHYTYIELNTKIHGDFIKIGHYIRTVIISDYAISIDAYGNRINLFVVIYGYKRLVLQATRGRYKLLLLYLQIWL